MVGFVDESGDSGTSGKPGESPYLVFSLVLFVENEAAERTDKAIDSLRGELHLRPDFEFKFFKTKKRNRVKFFERVKKENWFYFGIIIRKAGLFSDFLKSPDKLYNYSAKLMFSNAKRHLSQAKIVVDKSGSRPLRRAFSKYLREQIDPDGSRLKAIAHEESDRNNLVQLADMVAGAITRSMGDGKDDQNLYRDLIRSKESYVQLWPKPR